jgi:hypothetical protein
MKQHGIATLRRLPKWAGVFVLASASFAVVANIRPAHGQDLRYRPPAGSTISPAFDFFRGDVQMLDFYSGTVRPHRALRSAVARQNTLLNQQRLQIGRLQGQVKQIRRPEMVPTGTGGHFFDFSHYYPSASRGVGRSGP